MAEYDGSLHSDVFLTITHLIIVICVHFNRLIYVKALLRIFA